jgi:hypothetical protein
MKLILLITFLSIFSVTLISSKGGLDIKDLSVSALDYDGPN